MQFSRLAAAGATSFTGVAVHEERAVRNQRPSGWMLRLGQPQGSPRVSEASQAGFLPGVLLGSLAGYTARPLQAGYSAWGNSLGALKTHGGPLGWIHRQGLPSLLARHAARTRQAGYAA